MLHDTPSIVHPLPSLLHPLRSRLHPNPSLPHPSNPLDRARLPAPYASLIFAVGSIFSLSSRWRLYCREGFSRGAQVSARRQRVGSHVLRPAGPPCRASTAQEWGSSNRLSTPSQRLSSAAVAEPCLLLFAPRRSLAAHIFSCLCRGNASGRTRAPTPGPGLRTFQLRDWAIGPTLGAVSIRSLPAPVAQLASGHDGSGARSPRVVIQPATNSGPRARGSHEPAAICRVAAAWLEWAYTSREWSKSSGLLSHRCGFEPRRAYSLTGRGRPRLGGLLPPAPPLIDKRGARLGGLLPPAPPLIDKRGARLGGLLPPAPPLIDKRGARLGGLLPPAPPSRPCP